jgi:hypothetical protein
MTIISENMTFTTKGATRRPVWRGRAGRKRGRNNETNKGRNIKEKLRKKTRNGRSK